jgi:hypothetical protein
MAVEKILRGQLQSSLRLDDTSASQQLRWCSRVMPTFTRIRERSEAYQPISEGVKTEVIIHKRVNNNLTLEEFHWDDHSKEDNGKIIMDPYQTTVRRQVNIERSKLEKKYRQETSPCIVEMLQMREVLLKQKAMEEQKELRKQQRKKLLKEQLLKLETAMKEGNLENFEFDLGEDTNAEMNDGGSSLTEEEEEFQKAALFMKERRIVRHTQSNLMHIPLSNYRIFKRSFNAAWFGGKRFGPFTEILPWLYIGRGNIAKEERFFQALGFTHVMNCTREVHLLHSSLFRSSDLTVIDSKLLSSQVDLPADPHR